MAWPTTNDPKTEFATFRMTASEAVDLENAAAVRGLSKSAYVRECVERVMASDARKARRLKTGEDG